MYISNAQCIKRTCFANELRRSPSVKANRTAKLLETCLISAVANSNDIDDTDRSALRYKQEQEARFYLHCTCTFSTFVLADEWDVPLAEP